MKVAINRPSRMAGTALRFLMPSRAAMRDPVQAPVPGSGTPTNSTSPQNSNCLILSLFFSALFSRRSTMGRKVFVRLRRSNTLVTRSRMKGTGMRFPTMQTGMAVHMSTCSREAAIRPPRSSRIGIIEMMNGIRIGGRPPSSSVIFSASLSAPPDASRTDIHALRCITVSSVHI